MLPKWLLPKCPITETSYYQNVQLLKYPVTEMSVTKTSITKVSFTKMSGYRQNYKVLSAPKDLRLVMGICVLYLLPVTVRVQ